MSQTSSSPALKALTDWWAEMGVEADETQMRAWKKAAEETAKAAPAPPPVPPERLPRHLRKKTHEDWVNDAKELAAGADTLDALKTAIEGYDGCILKEAARKTAVFDGVQGAPVMVIGEGPGGEEDRIGLPFVGKAGKLLDKMLAAIGLSRTENTFITNVNYWRPPGNRNPSDEELELCRPFVDRMIELGQPKLIIAAGGVAAKSLLQSRTGIMKLRGTEHVLKTPGGYDGPLFPIFHPAFLLRRPEEKSRAWRDLLNIQARLEAL
ncbi:uracil-DNA glycosylase [Henriciella aquimarina]|uniref:uracil-DNA glycosylase n=1 Tax=Henriciella aquimarina TaxID=545261 RepID=UPI000A0144FB|nr:uracil-DNA glycosylase [Henriciella aquimarina]